MRFYYHKYYDEIEFEYYFSLIYSLYSLPNTILPLIGGKLVDIYGNNFILLLFSSFIFIGSIVETFGCMNTNLFIVVLGRFIFGLGAETVSVCVSIFISKWFRGQELAFALAFQLSMAKLASVLTDWISPELHRLVGLQWTSAVTTFICMASFLSTCLLITLDQRHDQEMVHQEYHELPMNNIDDNGKIELHTIERHDDEDTNLLAYYQLNSIDASSSAATTSSAIPITGHDYESQSAIDSQNVFTSLYMLPTILWLVLAVDFMMYGTFIPFTSWSNPILLQFYFNPTNSAATTISADSNLIANTGIYKGGLYSGNIEEDQIRAAW
jgi:MFS family permease